MQAAGGGSALGAAYKGIANSPAAQISALGATWCYNWGTTPKSTDCADPYFVPMIWGSGNVASALQSIGKAGYKTVLGFNEPNKTDQAHLSVAEAIALWPDLTSDPNIRVGSPAVSDDGRAWLEDFMDQVKKKGLRVDFIAMHWYGWNKGSCVASQLEGAVNWASKWGLPVWITEFGCMGSSNPDEKTVLDFFNSAIPMLAKHPLVERYAWYPWNTYNEVYASNAMTDLGKAFAAAPKYRP
ncbi:MAG TPA: glycosyl hydrolase [Polyangiaceae bacterium]|nr:glycosyl hydrolase [Polyangiaceae bacterium]